MDLDDLLYRRPLTGQPISFILLLQLPPVSWEQLDRLQDRIQPWAPAEQEWHFIGTQAPPASWPIRRHEVRRRFWQVGPSTWGESLQAVIAAAKHPILAFLDLQTAIEEHEFQQLVKSLDLVDLVLAERPQPGWRRWLQDWLSVQAWASRIFAVPLSDPLSPVRLVRRDAAVGMVFQLEPPLLYFEMIAKLTLMTSLMDQYRLANKSKKLDNQSITNGQQQVGFRDWQQLAKLYWQPRIWDWQPERRNFRPPLNAKVAESLLSVPTAAQHFDKHWLSIHQSQTPLHPLNKIPSLMPRRTAAPAFRNGHSEKRYQYR